MFRPKRETQSEAFVSEKVAPVLSGIAQVRQQVGELHYGERVEVLSKRNEYMKVRTPGGAIGWVEAHQLMEPALWQRSIKLLERVRDMPVQARGRTKVSTNLRVLPGRTEPRLYQFARNVPVEIVRSEEHTSELQSHHELVCRLLLEKKTMLCVTIFVILVVWFLLARVARLMIHTPTAISIFVCLSMVQLMAVFISMRCTLCGHFLQVALTLILVVGYAIFFF